MPLIDMFEAIDNPEGYISHQARNGPDNSESLRDIYATGANGGPQPHVREGRGVLGSLLQGVGILDPPPARELNQYEQYLYNKGGQESRSAQTTEESRQFNLDNARNNAKSNSLKDILAYVHDTRSMPDELLADHPEYKDDAERYLKIVNKAEAEAESDKNLTRRIRQKQLYTMGNPKTKDPGDVYGIRWGRWRAGNQETIDTFKTRVKQYMKITDPEQKRIMGQTLQQMQSQIFAGTDAMEIPQSFVMSQLGAELNAPPHAGLGNMDVFPEKNPSSERQINTLGAVQNQTNQIINNRRP